MRLKIGGYVELEFDAKLVRNGISWYRVRDGFGQRGDREDWVADVPGHSLSANDYNWNGDVFGPSYGTFEKALDMQAAYAYGFVQQNIDKARRRLADLRDGEQLLERATEQAGLEVTLSDTGGVSVDGDA